MEDGPGRYFCFLYLSHGAPMGKSKKESQNRSPQSRGCCRSSRACIHCSWPPPLLLRDSCSPPLSVNWFVMATGPSAALAHKVLSGTARRAAASLACPLAVCALRPSLAKVPM